MVGKSNMQLVPRPFSCKRDYPCLEHWRRGRAWPLHLILDSLGWGLYINRGIWDTFIRCWAAVFSRLLHPVCLSFVLSKAVLGQFSIFAKASSWPNRCVSHFSSPCPSPSSFPFCLSLHVVLLLYTCCTHSLIHSFGVVTVKDAFTVESVARILFLCLDVQHTSGGSTSRRPCRNVEWWNHAWKIDALLLWLQMGRNKK